MTDSVDKPTKVRTRFPPSPTGALHLGGARTAIFNWLLARHHGGEFVFRLEDTDKKRSKPEHVDSIMEAMEWLGLDWDLGPFYQTQRFDRYQEAIDRLLAEGKAYWCHCSAEEVDRQRAEAKAKGLKPMYQGVCRGKKLGPAPGAVVRFRGPRTGTTDYPDLVKGLISFENQELDDLVILRSDGTPTYHLAVVVDDIDMGITHVIRGDDHINNTPRQILLFRALGADLPGFGHMPLTLGKDKAKLSKRHGATALVAYRDMGYLPEAMLNFMVRLGWSHGDQEIFTRDELIEFFDLDHVGKSAAVFDPDRLLKLNSWYIQNTDIPRLITLVKPFLAQRGIEVGEAEQNILESALPELTARAQTLIELAEWAEPYLLETPNLDPKAAKKFLKPANAPVLEQVRALVAKLGIDDLEALEQGFRDLCAEMDLKLGKVAQPTRVALTGRTFSPGIFEVMAILGADKVLARLDQAITFAKSSK